MAFGLKRFQNAGALYCIPFCFHRLPLLDTPNPKNTVEAVNAAIHIGLT
jgi:hypothetical protein